MNNLRKEFKRKNQKDNRKDKNFKKRQIYKKKKKIGFFSKNIFILFKKEIEKKIFEEREENKEIEYLDLINELKEENGKLKEELNEGEILINKLNKDIEIYESLLKSNTLLKYKNIEGILSDNKLTKCFTGLRINEFHEIFNLIEEKLEKRTTKGEKIKNKKRKIKFDNKEQFFITLYWLRNYPKDEVMEFFFDLSRNYLMKIIRNIIDVLSLKINHFIKWPTEEEFMNYLDYFDNFCFEIFKKYICVVDGTEIRIRRPKENQKSFYSMKKSQHSMNFLIIVLLDGRIIYISKGKNNFNDQSFWNTLKIRKKFLNKEYGILGDGGFYFNPQKEEIEIKGITPRKKTENFNLSDQLFNESLSELRVIVENTIWRIKNWRILGDIFRHFSAVRGNTFNLNKIFRVCSCLANYLIQKRPLRDSTWRQRNNPIFSYK